MTRAYAAIAYASFVAAAAWAVIFLAVPQSPNGSWAGLPIDLALLLLFAVQHSVMARASVKRRMALPAPAERATYVLASSLALGLLFWCWQPLPGHIWHITAQPWAALIWAIYGLGWLIAVASTFMVDHLDFLGLRQAYQKTYTPQPFQERWLYAWVRHPMMSGLLLTFWAATDMSSGRFVFAVAGSAYIAVGVHFEERDLRRTLGAAYDDYAQRIPAVIPRVP